MAAASVESGIHLYTFATPNGVKISWFLEVLKAAGKIGAYETHVVNINKGEQMAPEFLKVSPNNKIPALEDRSTGVTLFESGAILMYLADQYDTDHTFLPAVTDAKARAEVLSWVIWSCASCNPALGQMVHFYKAAKEDVPYGKKRFLDESVRVMGVLDKQLVTAGSGFVCSTGLSLADFTVGPWFARLTIGLKDGPVPLDDFPHILKYADDIRAIDTFKAASAMGKPSE